MIQAKRQTFQYGARFSGDGKPAWKYWMSQEDFARELKMAFFEFKDLDKALAAVRQKVATEVRRRL